MTQGFSIEFFLNLNSVNNFSIKVYNMRHLLLVDCIKVYIDKEIISIELISSLFTHKIATDIMSL